jgi:hypothetical protein
MTNRTVHRVTLLRVRTGDALQPPLDLQLEHGDEPGVELPGAPSQQDAVHDPGDRSPIVEQLVPDDGLDFRLVRREAQPRQGSLEGVGPGVSALPLRLLLNRLQHVLALPPNAEPVSSPRQLDARGAFDEAPEGESRIPQRPWSGKEVGPRRRLLDGLIGAASFQRP